MNRFDRADYPKLDSNLDLDPDPEPDPRRRVTAYTPERIVTAVRLSDMLGVVAVTSKPDIVYAYKPDTSIVTAYTPDTSGVTAYKPDTSGVRAYIPVISGVIAASKPQPAGVVAANATQPSGVFAYTKEKEQDPNVVYANQENR